MKKLIWIAALTICIAACSTPKFYVYSVKPSSCLECKTEIIQMTPVNKKAETLCENNRYFCDIQLLVGQGECKIGTVISLKTLLDTTKFTNFRTPQWSDLIEL